MFDSVLLSSFKPQFSSLNWNTTQENLRKFTRTTRNRTGFSGVDVNRYTLSKWNSLILCRRRLTIATDDKGLTHVVECPWVRTMTPMCTGCRLQTLVITWQRSAFSSQKLNYSFKIESSVALCDRRCCGFTFTTLLYVILQLIFAENIA